MRDTIVRLIGDMVAHLRSGIMHLSVIVWEVRGASGPQLGGMSNFAVL